MYEMKTPSTLAALLALCLSSGAALAVAPNAQTGIGTATQASATADPNSEWTLTLLQMGDIHGHLIPRPHLRSDGGTAKLGGLAYLYSKIEEIRNANEHVMLFNTGDTIQGSAEALYTRGQALVDVLDQFDIDGFAPGNWDYLYGADRFVELFGNGRWGAVAANVYFDGNVYPDKAGQRVLPPYVVKRVNGLNIGIMGLSTERITLAPGPWATKGFVATSEGAELPELITELREQKMVDVVILVSEFGLAKNVWFAENYPGIDVVLSADMHEETREAIRTSNGTLITEVGQDGTRLGEVTLRMRGNLVAGSDYRFHTIDTGVIQPDPMIADLVNEERKEFVAGADFTTHVNPFNGMLLNRPIDQVVGTADVALHRSNYAHEDMPASVEGSSHNFLADAFREQAGADIGHIRGFRYGTHIAPGAIKLEDLYHYIAIGPEVAKTEITGQMLKNYLENNAEGSFSADLFAWAGGWQMGLSGVRYDLDVSATKGNRISNVTLQDPATGEWLPLDTAATYSIAGYWYQQNPANVAGILGRTAAEPVRGEQGEVIDGTEVVVNHLKTHSANPEPNRVRLLSPLPGAAYGSPEMQPLKGVVSSH